ncbi:MAG TPA: response regulator [Isosphaeraceae bacterium]|jgi:DNA-binding response OmpR family regulator|nr:response regulator [Isosphaeraceae bacterium]
MLDASPATQNPTPTTGRAMNTLESAVPTPPRPRRVLLVEDNPEGSAALERVLSIKGYEVVVAPDCAAALEALDDGPAFDFVLTDLLLPGGDGREVARAARELDPPPRIALITGWTLDAPPLDGDVPEVDHVFLKPLDVRALLAEFLDPPADGPGA